MVFRIALYWVAALLMGAHFLRAGNIVLVLVCIGVPLAFFYRRRPSLVLLQTLAYAAAAEWLYTAWQLIQMRQAFGRSWTLAAVILGTVALYSVLAGVLLNSRVMRERYPEGF